MLTRQLLTALGVAAIMAAVLATAPASAATGVLRVGDDEYRDPVGCYLNRSTPLRVENDTDRIVVLFHDSKCGGDQIGLVAPGSKVVSVFGGSVQVP